MCLILIAVRSHPDYRLVIVSNRDEYRTRPTARAHFWEDAPDVLAGRDMDAGGTWLGITKKGRIAALTNNQNPHFLRSGGLSRGKLASGFLFSVQTPKAYSHWLTKCDRQFSGFNLIFGEKDALCWYSNLMRAPHPLGSGIYGISNALLDTPWPKVTQGKTMLQRLFTEKPDWVPEDLFSLMSGKPVNGKKQGAPLFGTAGYSKQSSMFLIGPVYGTRSSTILIIDNSDHVTFLERTFDAGGHVAGTVRFEFQIEA